jgi:hypothetical protein
LTTEQTDLTPEQKLFLASDAALREVIDQLTPAMLELPVPAEWSTDKTTSMSGLLANHAKDEAWVPDVIAGKTMEQVGDTWTGDLLGDDPIDSYDKLNDLAAAAVSKPIADGQVAHLSYGDFPVAEFLEHTSYYRGFQAPLIAKVAGIRFAMSDDLVDMLWASVEPNIDQLRAIHVFGPPIEVPDGSNREALLLGMTGFWRP